MKNTELKAEKNRLRIDQANVFYNYVMGFEASSINLLGTAGKLLKAGIAKAVFFSDFKCLYTDPDGEVQLEWVQPCGRQWGSNWEIKFDQNVPEAAKADFVLSMDVSFIEKRIEGCENSQLPPYLRASLPPIVLESNEFQLPIFVSIKLFGDGIAILSFQLDCTWKGVDEEYFISNIVNIYQIYFNHIWVDSRIQKLDSETLLPAAFQDEISIAGNPIIGRKINKLLRKMRNKSQMLVDEALGKQGRKFEIANDEWVLHEIVGANDQGSCELTFDLCRSEYFNAMSKLLVINKKQRNQKIQPIFLWQGRPSVTLMRYQGQPANKKDLLKSFAHSLSRILMRATTIDTLAAPPKDLRPFGDYCFHGNRSLFLWTWLRPYGTPNNAWNDSTTRSRLMENQARAEHIEYHNMRAARACAMAQSSPSDSHLVEAYKTLASINDVMHHSSQAGEISDALKYLMEEIGTVRLVNSAKEAARWHLDERRYRSDKRRTQVHRWLFFVFGLVGATGLADFAIMPFLIIYWPGLSLYLKPLVALGIAFLIIFLMAVPIFFLKGKDSGD